MHLINVSPEPMATPTPEPMATPTPEPDGNSKHQNLWQLQHQNLWQLQTPEPVVQQVVNCGPGTESVDGICQVSKN